MAWVKEFGAVSGSASSVDVTVPAGGVAAGSTLILAAVAGDALDSITDDGGNTWTILGAENVGATSTHVALAYCVVTTPLAENDVITVNETSGTTTRWAITVQNFSEAITSVDGGDWFDNGGSSTAVLTAGDATTNDTSGLIFAGFALVNPGRTFTAGASFTAGTKQASTVGSGDRAVVAQWRYVGSGTYDTPASLNSSGTWVGMSQGFGLDAGSPPTGTVVAKVWNGSSWDVAVPRRWNGSSWDEAAPRVYDGSDWEG